MMGRPSIVVSPAVRPSSSGAEVVSEPPRHLFSSSERML